MKRDQNNQRVLVLPLILFAIQTIRSTPYKGCLSISENGDCNRCYKSHLLPNRKGCGSPRAAGDHCSIYAVDPSINQTQCSECDPGYALKVLGTQQPFCVVGTIQDCVYETLWDAGLDNGQYCDVCSQGKYSVVKTRAPTTVTACEVVSEPTANCRYGGYLQAGQVSCFKCIFRFSVSIDTSTCVPEPVLGCWIVNNDKCVMCDPEQGYSMNNQGVCFKTYTGDE